MVEREPKDDAKPRPVHWVGNSLQDLGKFPDEARRNIGFALFFAQNGVKHSSAKPLRSHADAA